MKLLKLARVDVVGAMFCELRTRLLPLSSGVGCGEYAKIQVAKIHNLQTNEIPSSSWVRAHREILFNGNWQLATSKTTTLTTRVDDDIIQILHNLRNGYNEHEA